MDYTEQERIEQQLHRVVDRFKPDRRRRYLLAEEFARYDLRRVAEPAAEHRAPEHGRDSAIEEHIDRLFHPGFELELSLGYKHCDDHYHAVARVREHDAEEDIVEERHNGVRVDIVAVWHRIHFGYRLDGRDKGVVFEQHRHIGICIRVGNFDSDRVFLFERVNNFCSPLLGDISREDEDAVRHGYTLKSRVFFFLYREIINDEADIIVAARKLHYFGSRRFGIFFVLLDLLLKPLISHARRMLRRVGRISEIERSQHFEYLFFAFPVAYNNGASALAVSRDYLRVDFAYLRRCRRYRFEQRLRVILRRERADKHRRRIRALAFHRDIEAQPRLERVHRGAAPDIVRRIFAHIRFERVYPVALAEYFVRLVGFFKILRNLELLSAAERRHEALHQSLFLRSIFVERFLRALRRREVPFKGRNGDAR